MTNQSNKVSDKDIKSTKTKAKTSDAGAASKKKEKKPVVVAEDTPTSEDVDASTGEVDGEVDGKKKRVAPTKDSVIKYFDDLIKSIEDEVENLRESENKTKGVKFLRTLNKRLKILKNQSSRIIKQKRTTTRTNTNNNSGFLKPVKISKEMAKFTGWNSELPRSRVEVTKFLCNYIKEHELQNPADRRQILADDKLTKLLKYDVKKEKEPLTYFRVQTCLKNHFIKPDAPVVSA
jgi:chromatin remodeling complex protein RSC6